MRSYIAKTKHKRPCDMCGEEVRVGDAAKTWAWVNPDEGPGSGNFGNIMRVHATCNEIESRCPRELFSPGSWPEAAVAEAAAALSAARAKTPAGQLERAVALLRRSMSEPMGDEYTGAAAQLEVDIEAFLGEFSTSPSLGENEALAQVQTD